MKKDIEIYYMVLFKSNCSSSSSGCSWYLFSYWTGNILRALEVTGDEMLPETGAHIVKSNAK